MANKVVKWTDDEVAEMLALVAENGQAEGIKRFSEKSGRTVDGIRRKLNYVRESLASDATDEVEVETQENTVVYDEDSVREEGTENYAETEPCWLTKLWRWICGQN